MAWWKREKGDASGATSEATLEELRRTAREWIATGFHEREGLAEALVEFRDDLELPDGGLAMARAAVAEEWAARLAVESSWAGQGDYARVQAAFDDLAGQGIVGRMNFTCCQTCGTAEIDDERTPRTHEEAAADDGYPFHEWGYTFFHQQDAERLANEPADLYLSYSTFRPAPDLDPVLLARADDGDHAAQDEAVRQSDLSVGRQVVAALERQGLTVEWPEDPATRIRLAGLRWRKPLPAR